jgi:hypothetical protein
MMPWLHDTGRPGSWRRGTPAGGQLSCRTRADRGGKKATHHRPRGITYPSFRPPVPPWIGFLVLPAAAGVRDELELRPNVSFSLCFMSLTEHRFTRTITIRFSTS